jgi:endonuclease-3
MNKKNLRFVLDTLEEMYPEAFCELTHSNPFELTIAVVLSAQCTDKKVNSVTKHLFEKYKTPQDYLSVTVEEIEEDIKSIGLFRSKAKHIQGLCRLLQDQYGNQIPNIREELIKLPGVGRKTANVVISNAFNTPAIAVDTHVERVSKRLGICKPEMNVLEVEKTLMKKIPKEEWTQTHHRLVFFGRYHCKAQKPNCLECPLLSSCPEGKKRKDF